MNSSLNCATRLITGGKFVSASLQLLLGASALEKLDSVERTRLEAAHWLEKSFAKGSAIIDEGADRENVSILLSGWAFRFQTLADGKRQILDFIFAGSLIGFGCGPTHSYGVEAATGCRIASHSYVQFRRLLSVCPSLAMHVAERVSDSEMRAHEHITSLGRRGARERIAAFIVELASQTPRIASARESRSFELPLTQIMIGDALGLSNEHVCRILGKLASDGILRFNRHMLEVLDEAALMREAGMDKDQSISHRRMLPLAA